GVGGVDINGGQNRQINVFLDLNKLSGYNLTAQDVNTALQNENIETPGGRIVRGLTEVGVRTMGRVEDVAEFNNIIIKNVGGSPFIRDWRSVLTSSFAIPTSIVTTFMLLRGMDCTLNSMTLLGLTLAVGIVIDDAIIVLENIYRFIDEKDMPPMQAAVAATKEIAMAVIATTLSLVIIFIPIAFMSGYARRFLNQFGWTMAMSILVSMLVAFTLTPTLSARMLRKKPGKHDKPKAEGESHGWFDRIYVRSLEWSL